jgi:hypothetical protein
MYFVRQSGAVYSSVMSKGDVSSSFSKRWHLNRKNVEPVGQLGNRDKLGNPGRFLIQRCLAVKFHKENGIVATREGDFESLRPDHYQLIETEPLRPYSF